MILSTLENKVVTKREVDSPIFEKTCDVLVIGAGSAGCYAADSAARAGAKVILCEISDNIGGMSVTGNVTGYYFGMQGGSFALDDKKSREDTAFLTNKAHWEQRQIHITERLLDSGVEILAGHSAIGLYFEENRVVGIRAFDGERCFNIRATFTVDATSDGHLIRMTDVKKRYGRASDGGFVPFTVRAQYVKDGKLVSSNADSGIADHYDKNDFSEKVIFARAGAADLLKKGDFVNLALQTGVREGLSFEGECCLGYEDVLLERHSDKPLFYAYSDFDRHGNERASEEELFQNWFVISNLSTVLIGIPVPFGSVVPKGIRGLVSAGRCISVDTYLGSAVRMNRDMFRMGECIGVAAAMAAKQGCDFLDIDYDEYLRAVNLRGCFADEERRGFYFDNSFKWYTDKMKALGRQPDPKYPVGKQVREKLEFDFWKNLQLLSTDAPGVAIWSAYVARDKEKVAEKLSQLILSEDEILRYNAAIALGIIGDNRAVAVLREIVERRDCFFFTDNRRSNQFRSVVATCLLGRLGGEDELSLLFDILSRDESEREMYRTLAPNYLYGNDPSRNMLYFQMVTHAAVAIVKITEKLGGSVLDLRKRFRDIFSDGYILGKITTAPLGSPQYDETWGFMERMMKVDF